MDFKFPPIYDFPPFFTHQINEQTWKSQLESWDALVLSYCKHHRIFRLGSGGTAVKNVPGEDSTSDETTDSGDLFANGRIQRALKPDTIRAIFEYMVKQGHAEWQSTAKDGILVYFKRPDEWAALIRRWVDSSGQTGTVLTFYEITDGELTESEEFHGLDPMVLRKAIDVLVQRNQAAVVKTTDGQVMGVKVL